MRAHRFLLPVIACAALTAGCGSDASEPTPSSTTTEHGGLAHCLSEHGVTETAVSPAGPPAGVDQKTWDEAMRSCSSLAPGPAAP